MHGSLGYVTTNAYETCAAMEGLTHDYSFTLKTDDE